MLSIDETCPQVWIEHEETKTRYLIRPIEPRDSQKLLRRSRDKAGGIDYVKHNGLTVDFAVVEWEGVGARGVVSPCTSENKIRFGERFGKIVGFISEKASDPALFMDEEGDAKND